MIALRPVLDDVWAVLTDLSPEEAWAPTGCQGWMVHDLTWHMLADARRGLVALHTPAEPEAAGSLTTRVTYWADWGVPEADAGQLHLRLGRLNASASDWAEVRDSWRETTAALCHAVEAARAEELVRSQGHTLRVDDLVHTLAVEAALHHLDLVTHLHGPVASGPSAESAALVREALDGVLELRVGDAVAGPARRRDEVAAALGRTASLDDRDWARLGTGRADPTPSQREGLGPVAALLPLFA